MHTDDDRIDRQELYEKVWTMPMWRLAGRYGLSDVGLAKICKKLDVPVPGRGYWQKLKSGKAVSRDPLLPLAEGGKDHVILGGKAENGGGEEVRSDGDKHPERRIVVADTLKDPHPLVKKMQKALARAEKDESSLLSGQTGSLKVIVSEDSVDRACRIMNALLKALEDRGHTVSVDEERGETKVDALGGSAVFSLVEIVDRRERLLTPAKEKDKAKNPWRYSMPHYDRVPSGRLSLRVDYPSWQLGRRTWSDGKRQRLEKVLDSFIAGLLKAAVIEREWKIRNERWEQERKEEERRREERRRLREAEERKLWALLTDAICWHRSQQLRAYVQATKDRAKQAGSGAPLARSLEAWIEWALQQADHLDPLANGYCRIREDSHNPKRGHQNYTEPTPISTFDLVWQRLLTRSEYYDSPPRWGW